MRAVGRHDMASRCDPIAVGLATSRSRMGSLDTLPPEGAGAYLEEVTAAQA